MRIISGSLRGRRIRSPRGNNIRPTSDKVREAYFNILGQYFDGVSVLDLFCGTGAIGFEFLSRGAKRVFFVDTSISFAKKNADLLNITDRCRFFNMSAEEFLKKRDKIIFDYIYVDPPYRYVIVNNILSRVDEELLSEKGILTVEHSLKVQYPDRVGRLYLFKQRRFGDTVLSFYSLDASNFEERL
ncbi:MAG: 16S rRNA (guanine(966)-N(2))-methyltransferase RsmD [Deltaproteobacteria bacterium]|nr:16S rRNA (guanine(966)-N(2))-methyltransferase RsmD [Deltaproteobacteria bacterium]